MSNTTERGVVSPTSHYGYIPTLWICGTFVALFGTTTLLHLGQAFYYKPRLYWIIPTVALCGLGEVIGWSGRLWSSKNPLNGNAYLMQITCTIIAPVFLTAALYTILGLIINILGSEYSRFKSKTYLKVFVTADVLALVIQAAGGGIASSANTDSGSKLGANVMLAGIFLQMVTLIVYVLLATEFLLRFHLQRPLNSTGSPSRSSSLDEMDTVTAQKTWIPGQESGRVVDGRGVMSTRTGLMVLGLTISTVFVFVRTIYRTVELLGGWHGHILRTQIYFDVLDAMPIVVALFILNFLPPGLLLRSGSITSS